MFIEYLNWYDFHDLGLELGVYADATRYSMDTVKETGVVNVEMTVEGPYSLLEFCFSDFNVKAWNEKSAIIKGRVKAEWIKFMTRKFGRKYIEAYKQYNQENNKKDYDDKDLLDLGN